MSNLLYNDIVTDIEDQIAKGELKDGSKLPSERELTNRYKVSRTVVREAIRVLREKGFVEVHMGRGAFITKPKGTIVTDSLERMITSTESKILDILDVREDLELSIIRKAVAKSSMYNIEILKIIYEEMERKKLSISEFIEEDARFHLELAKATQNNIYYVLSNSFLDLSDKALFQVTRLTPYSVHEAQKQHWDIIRALETKDEQFGVDTIKKHIQMIREEINMLHDQNILFKKRGGV